MRLRNLLLTVPFILGVANAEAVIYKKLEGMPISESVEIPAGKNLVFLSGKVPTRLANDAPADSLEAYGNTEVQTINVMEQIKANLEQLGLTMDDVVKMQVFLVGGEETNGFMDFKGFMDGYTKFYDGSTEKLPARSAFQVAKLAHPAWRVEIEVTAVRP